MKKKGISKLKIFITNQDVIYYRLSKILRNFCHNISSDDNPQTITVKLVELCKSFYIALHNFSRNEIQTDFHTHTIEIPKLKKDDYTRENGSEKAWAIVRDVEDPYILLETCSRTKQEAIKALEERYHVSYTEYDELTGKYNEDFCLCQVSLNINFNSR